MVYVVILITGVLAYGVIDVLGGIVFVDGDCQSGEVALTGGEVVVKTYIEGAGLVNGGVVVAAFGKEISIMVIPPILHAAGRHIIGEVASERAAVGDRGGLRINRRDVHRGHCRDSRTLAPCVGIVTLNIESGACHDASGEIEPSV